MERTAGERELAVDLAARGLRATRQRIGILALLRRSRSHPTAAQLHRLLVAKSPNVSLKTVYGVLDSLVATGLATSVVEGGHALRYEAAREPHYHARCRACDHLYDLEGHSDAHIRSRTGLPEGFSVERIAVTIVGVCPRCRGSL